jgi:hypothetical protein
MEDVIWRRKSNIKIRNISGIGVGAEGRTVGSSGCQLSSSMGWECFLNKLVTINFQERICTAELANLMVLLHYYSKILDHVILPWFTILLTQMRLKFSACYCDTAQSIPRTSRFVRVSQSFGNHGPLQRRSGKHADQLRKIPHTRKKIEESLFRSLKIPQPYFFHTLI